MGGVARSLLQLSMELLAVLEDGRFVQANHRWQLVLGWSEDELLGRHYSELVHPEDLPATEALSGEATGFANRFRHKDGGFRWLLWESCPLPGGRWLCAARDITREREMLAERERLAAAQSALRSVATVVASGASPARVFSAVSEEAGKLFAADAAAVVMRVAGGLVRVMGAWSRTGSGPVARGALLELGERGAAAGGGEPPASAAVATRALTGSLGFGSSITSAVRVENREWGLLIAVCERPGAFDAEAEARLGEFAELTAMAVANAESRRALEQRALTDSLTAFMNNRAFHDRLAAEVERARRHGRALALAVIDLDRFKEVNDTHGHRAGDEVLSELAEAIRANHRLGDLVGRVGGDELALILTDCTAEDARRTIDRLRPAVARIRVLGGRPLTFSAGVCDLADAETPEALFRRADEALYRSKAAGRSVTTVFGED